ncbi:MAG: DUF6069 family protein [Microbacterium sp.]|uniref:DUF6069 family protein n=1 Tax=Microbacterium sp. TaxID=51671 RepID=UPI0039E4FBE5
MNKHRITTRIAVVVAGALAASIVWALALLAGGIQVPLTGAPADLPLWQAALVALAVGLAGWGLLALLEWRLARPCRIWAAVATLVVLLSLSGPLLTPQIEAGDRMWLLAMHLALGAAYIPAMARTARSGERAPSSAASRA